MTLRSAARPRWALAGHSAGTCISSGELKSHLSFTCSSLIHTSFTCGSLGLQHVPGMLHNLLNRAWRPASTKHSLILWFSAKALPILVPLISFQCPFFLLVFCSQTLPGPFHCQMPTMWPMTETGRPTLIPLSVIKLPIFVSVKQLTAFYWCSFFAFKCTIQILLVIGALTMFALTLSVFKLKIKI